MAKKTVRKSTIMDLHADSLEHDRMAGIARVKGRMRAYRAELEKAFRLAEAAAEGLYDAVNAQPTRAALYLHAASLAMELNEHDRAAGLINEGRVHAHIEELRDFLEMAKGLH